MSRKLIIAANIVMMLLIAVGLFIIRYDVTISSPGVLTITIAGALALAIFIVGLVCLFFTRI